MIWYLCGPIDFDKDGQSWKNKFKELTTLAPNLILFDPNTYHFSGMTPQIAEYIHDVNMCAIDKADGVIARWNKDKISIGTPIELYYAVIHNKKIILITDIQSVYIKYIANKCLLVTDNVDVAYDALVSIERGLIWKN